MNQPPCGAALKKIEPQTNTPPIRKHQKPNADSRGNGRSRAPSSCGSTSIENASKIGTANRNILAEPCSENSWLYISALTKSLSGTASCTRISSASTPANRKNTNDMPVYQSPTLLLLTADQ